MLRELTDLLPTDTWLTTMSLDAKGVELTGQAAAASTLIPLLENSPRLERVEFSSPVTRGRDKEQFRIRAAWETGAAAAAPRPAPGKPRRRLRRGTAAGPVVVPDARRARPAAAPRERGPAMIGNLSAASGRFVGLGVLGLVVVLGWIVRRCIRWPSAPA